MKCRVFVPIVVLFIAVIAAQLKSTNIISDTNTADQVAMCCESSAFRFADEIDMDEWLPPASSSLSDDLCILPDESFVMFDPLISKFSVSANSEVKSADVFAHKSWH